MMFKSSLIFLSLSAALELVWASSVTITTPEANTVWKAGSTMQIKWDVNEPSGPIRLQYASGPSKSLTINGLIADNVTAALGEYSWTIPKDIKPKKYVIEAGPSAKDLSFAGYINITNDRKTKTYKPKTIKTKSTKKTSVKKTSVKKTKKTKKTHSTKSITKKTHTKKTHTKKTVTKKTHTKKTHTKKTKTVITIPKPITKKKTQTKKKTTTTSVSATKPGGKPSAVCVGYPARHEGADFSEEKVRCHSLPKAAQAHKKKATTKKAKKTHTKKTHTKKTHTKKTHTKKTKKTTTTSTASAQ